MQKLDFVEAIEKVYKEMFTGDVVSDIESSLTPGLSKYGSELAITLWDMYSNYNALKKDKRYFIVLSALNGDELFTSENIANLFKLFQGDIGQIDFLKNREFRQFLDFHFTLNATYEFTKKLLSQKKVKKSIGERGENGVLIFRIFNEDDGLGTDVYIKIFKALELLFVTVSEIEGDGPVVPKIILLDSGSDTNLGLEAGAKASATIFQTFKQIYDFIRFRRHERVERDNRTLLESLNVISEIKSKVAAKEITEQDGQQYTHHVKTTLNTLLGLNVIPKELADETENVNIMTLLNRGPIGLIGEGEVEGINNNIAE
jgi:hypothetical protein